MNSRLLTTCLVLMSLFSCKKDQASAESPSEADSLIRSVDISSFPEIRDAGINFFDANGKEREMLLTLKDAGINTIRLRLWVDPATAHSSLPEVEAFSRELQQMGFEIWITLHYSDTWADPGHQSKPSAWNLLDFNQLLDTVFQYTYQVADLIQPAIIQIGNEINNGLLYPEGSRSNGRQFHQLLNRGIKAVRQASTSSRIMLHYAGHENSEFFYSEVDSLDYDLIGISYYPIWHGKDLDSLENKLVRLGDQFKREVILAETAYPFTLSYNDWTNNIVGLPEQLIPGIPASVQGQKEFLEAIRKICDEHTRITGFSYWGAEWVAWKGPQAVDGSPWENQALFDFNNRALEAMTAFRP